GGNGHRLQSLRLEAQQTRGHQGAVCVLTFLAGAEARCGNLKEAQQAANQATAQRSAPAAAYLLRGGNMGDNVVQAYQRAPYDPEIAWACARLAWEGGSGDYAKAILKHSLRRWPEHPHLHSQLATIQLSEGETQAGLERLSYAIHLGLPRELAIPFV